MKKHFPEDLKSVLEAAKADNRMYGGLTVVQLVKGLAYQRDRGDAWKREAVRLGWNDES